MDQQSELSFLLKKTYLVFHRAYFYKCRYHTYRGEKKRDKICNLIKFVRNVHIFITFLSWRSGCQTTMNAITSSRLACRHSQHSGRHRLHHTHSLWLQANGTPASKKERSKWIFVIASSIKPSTILFWSWLACLKLATACTKSKTGGF